jgi:3-oxoacyl-[acyl-carrier protein] reductase
MVAERTRVGTLLGRFPTRAEVAEYSAFVASDRARAMTGAIANLTCGSLVD